MNRTILSFALGVLLLGFQNNFGQQPVRKILPQSILTGKAVKLLKPPFPSGWRGIIPKNNRIVVEFTVNEKGFVEEAKVISGHPLFHAVCAAAIRRSKFSASLNNVTPVKSYGIIVYDFVLRKKGWQSRVINYELKPEK